MNGGKGHSTRLKAKVVEGFISLTAFSFLEECGISRDVQKAPVKTGKEIRGTLVKS
jgi:hypothetical protein